MTFTTWYQMGQQTMTTVSNGATPMATVEPLQFGEIHVSSRVKFVLIIAHMVAVLHFTLSKVTTTLPHLLTQLWICCLLSLLWLSLYLMHYVPSTLTSY